MHRRHRERLIQALTLSVGREMAIQAVNEMELSQRQFRRRLNLAMIPCEVAFVAAAGGIYAITPASGSTAPEPLKTILTFVIVLSCAFAMGITVHISRRYIAEVRRRSQSQGR